MNTTANQYPESLWTTKKPVVPGAYYVRGFQYGDEVQRPALVEVLFASYKGGGAPELLSNLHEVNSEDFTVRFDGYPISQLDENFEWLGPLTVVNS